MNTKDLKVLSISALLAACLATLHAQEGKSGVFIGVEGGYGINFERIDPITPNAEQQQDPTTTTATTRYPYAVLGLKAGYGHYFSQKLGLRGYAIYHYGVNGYWINEISSQQGGGTDATSTRNNTIYNSHQVSANVEAVWDFLQLSQTSLGVYAGLGIGYGSLTVSQESIDTGSTTTTETNAGSGLILPINIGLEVGIGEHHRAELNFRIPTIAASFKDNLQSMEHKNRNLIISVGYTYIF